MDIEKPIMQASPDQKVVINGSQKTLLITKISNASLEEKDQEKTNQSILISPHNNDSMLRDSSAGASAS